MRTAQIIFKSLKARKCAIFIGGEQRQRRDLASRVRQRGRTAANLYDTSSEPGQCRVT